MATVETRPEQETPVLKRHVGVVGLLFASVGSIIGSGWLFGALNASQQAGPAAIISWVFGALLILLIALVYAELGTMMPLSGGVVRFPHMAFGHFASFTCGWITYVAVATTAPDRGRGGAAVRHASMPPSRRRTRSAVRPVYTLTPLGYAAAVVLMAVFVVINYYGVRWFARINNALVSAGSSSSSCSSSSAFFLSAFHGENFSCSRFRALTGVARGLHRDRHLRHRLLLPRFPSGHRAGRRDRQPAAERAASRSSARCCITGRDLRRCCRSPSSARSTRRRLSSSGSWAKLAFANDFGPLAALATTLGLGWLAILLYIDAIVSPGDTGLIYTTITSRISFAMARNRNAPKVLARTSDSGVPMVGLMLAFVIGLIAFLPFPSWQQLVGFITSATVLSFSSGPLVLAALRKQVPDARAPLPSPGRPR